MNNNLYKKQFKFIKTKLIDAHNINSLLFIPAIKEKFYNKILQLQEKPDCIIFDLEDSININQKNVARDILLSHLCNSKYRNEIFNQYKIIIRINPIKSEFFKEDILAIKKIKPDILMTSKTETASEIKEYKKVCPQFIVLIETLNGFSNLDDILKEMRKTDLFVLGYEDLSSELLIERPDLDSFNPLSHIFLSSLILARKNSINMIDSVFRSFKTENDLQKLKKECVYTSNLNLIGKLAIHPNQISIINNIFRSRKDKIIKKANKIITKFEELNDGSFVTIDENNDMIDTPAYKLSKEIIKNF